MTNLQTDEQLFTEAEAAGCLNVSLERLHHLLDEYIFNNGEARPSKCMFRSADLVLLSYWLRTDPNSDPFTTPSAKIIRMPRRN